VIGIPSRLLTVEGIPRATMATTYTRALDRVGGAPILIPPQLDDDSLRAILARLDGLMLAGGVDVHPREYGEAIQDFCGEIDAPRDQVELRLTRAALENHLPVFGICRGIQMLNVAAGGSLYQDIAAQAPGALTHPHQKGEPYNRLTHAVEIDEQSRLARALGVTQMRVNSLHHQSVKQVAPGFRVVARAPDGVIEGIEATNGRFALGVQWHPEWLQDDDPRMLDLFGAFVRACDRSS
jgi:putative glutamine amidotransferase